VCYANTLLRAVLDGHFLKQSAVQTALHRAMNYIAVGITNQYKMKAPLRFLWGTLNVMTKLTRILNVCNLTLKLLNSDHLN
jgi:hypothetical protein